MELETVPRIFALLGAITSLRGETMDRRDVVKPDTGEVCRFKRHAPKVWREPRTGILQGSFAPENRSKS